MDDNVFQLVYIYKLYNNPNSCTQHTAHIPMYKCMLTFALNGSIVSTPISHNYI